jgi:pimeloyl-ACP methyl ester carboxylesterase
VSAIECETWGAGARAVLVHGSLATGPLEWGGQRPLADEGYQLVVPTRRAYVPEPVTEGEDFLADTEDIAPLLGDGAHLVGHSYGGIVAMLAAAARPEAVHSLVLAEPPVFSIAPENPDVALLRTDVERVFAREGSDREFLESFLRAVGTPLDELGPEMLSDLTRIVPALRSSRPPWEARVPAEPLAQAPFPILVISGNHHPAFTAMSDALARDLGAERHVVEGAGHEMQMVTEQFNAVLLALWGDARAGAGTA